MDAADETMCWCASAEGLLRALIPYAIRSFNDDADDARRLFADHGIVDVGAALQPFHDGAIIIVEAEREAARRIVAGVTTQADADKLIVELGAIIVTRALLMLRTLIQRLNGNAKRDAHRAKNEGTENIHAE